MIKIELNSEFILWLDNRIGGGDDIPELALEISDQLIKCGCLKVNNSGEMQELEKQQQSVIAAKLDRIIELLESIEAYQPLYSSQPGATSTILPFSCTCHEKGRTTAYVPCPIHG